MKIALVAPHVTPAAQSPGAHCADPYCDDQAAHVLGLGQALAAQGHRVVIYARKDSRDRPARETLASRLAVEYLRAGPAAPLSPDQLPAHLGAFAGQLAARLSRTAPDVVHAYHWTNGLAALLAAKEHDVPVVQTFGSLAVTERRRGAGRQDAVRLRMEASVARGVAGVLATTGEEAGDLARLGIPGSRVRCVPCGVDTKRFSQRGSATQRSCPPRLLHVGSLAADQRLDVLIGALAEVPSAELVIAGGPDAADLDKDMAYKALGKLAAGLGVADRVVFTGRVDGSALPALLRSADLFVSAARHEPLGITAISAMSCGTPVVAQAVGGYADAVIDGTSGLLVQPGRLDLLARRLRDLLASPMKTTAFGIAAADRARSRYPWQRIADETAAAYERFIATPAARSDPGAVVSGLPAKRTRPATESKRAA